MTALDRNRASYSQIYGSRRTFLRYPADWVIRFHNIFMRPNIPTGRVLDFGCGSGNNLAFFHDQGYEAHGTEITPEVLPLIAENRGDVSRVKILDPACDKLPYPDGHFDLILSNQVLYYLASEANIRLICKEFSRVLRPGGAVFFTMIGPRNYYIRDHATALGSGAFELAVTGRIEQRQIVYVVPDEAALVGLFSDFEPLTVGYFDQSMFDLKSNFHWIFAGTRS